jgi:hypothetical protein
MSSNRNIRQIILDNDPIIPVVGHSNDAVQLGLFTGIFAALMQAMTGPARFFILPVVLVSEFVRVVLASVNFINAVNRNLSKTAKALLEITKMLVIATAIIGSFIGVVGLVAVAPFLFVAALGTNMVYHTTKILFHAAKWATAKGVHGKNYHKKELTHSVVSAVTGAISVAAITLLLIINPAAGVLTAVAAYGTAGIMGASALWSGVQAMLSYRKRDENKLLDPSEGIPQAEVTAEKQELLLEQKPLTINVESPRPLLRAPILTTPSLEAFHDDLIEEVLTDPNPKAQVLDLLKRKIGVLNQQLQTHSFFQDNQRQQKVTFLKDLHMLVSGQEVLSQHGEELTQINSPTKLLAHVNSTKKINNIFGSFYSEVGEVQKLFLLVDAYFTKYTPVVSMIGNKPQQAEEVSSKSVFAMG